MKKNDDLVTRVLELPEPERASLARQLLLSLEPPDFDSDNEAAWAVELEARIAAVEEGRFRATDWRKALRGSKRMKQAARFIPAASWVARPESSKGVAATPPTPFEDSGRATRYRSLF